MSIECSVLHRIFNAARKYTYQTEFNGIPKNGIYILFEKGEFAHGGDRIVRIGTHTGDNQLPLRINQHFLMENKNRSIFRKNIGRCFLAGHYYAEKWEYDTTSRAGKEKYNWLLDFDFEKMVEKKITAYMQEKLSFAVFPVKSKTDRLRIEAGLISTISHCTDCKHSQRWIGLKSPKEKIRKSGLWQVNKLWGELLDVGDLEMIEKISK